MDEVYVTGQPTQVDAAIEALVAKVEMHEAESYMTSVTVPVEFHSRIIGPRGATIDQYRKKFNVNVNVPKGADADNNNVNDQITIRGLKANADAAKADMEATISQWQNMVKQDCTLDPRIHSRIIGGRGKGIAKIMDDFSVDIRFPRADDADPSLVTVTGVSEDSVLDAIDCLKNLEEEYMQDHSERTQYERPPVVKTKKAEAVQQMRISNAPWDMTQDFPTIDVPVGSTSGAPSAGGAWGRPR
jgi:polyribonucleotide nucleotidyltransferase